MRQVRLRFPGTPPPLPKIPGLLQAVRSEGELRDYLCPLQRGHRGGAARAGAGTDGAGAHHPGGRLHQLPRRPGREVIHPFRNGGTTMKTLLRKELRENVKLAALGLVIYTLLLLQQYQRLYGW